MPPREGTVFAQVSTAHGAAIEVVQAVPQKIAPVRVGAQLVPTKGYTALVNIQGHELQV